MSGAAVFEAEGPTGTVLVGGKIRGLISQLRCLIEAIGSPNAERFRYGSAASSDGPVRGVCCDGRIGLHRK
jgi:hypothetical protein